jgi:hypothetical protein
MQWPSPSRYIPDKEHGPSIMSLNAIPRSLPKLLEKVEGTDVQTR